MTIARLAQPVKQLAQRDQISHPERATASSHRHERILITKVLINEEHPILPPRLADRHEHKLAPHPRMERMRHPHSSLPASRSRRSRQ
jgi:hypothetical protein